MSYATEADLDVIWGASRITLLSSDEMSAARNGSKIAAALADACATINSYVARRYALPLAVGADGATVLRKICADLAVYALATSADRMTEIIAKRYEAAMGWLRDVAAAKADLAVIVDSPAAPEISPNEAVLVGPGRIFSRDTMRGL